MNRYLLGILLSATAILGCQARPASAPANAPTEAAEVAQTQAVAPNSASSSEIVESAADVKVDLSGLSSTAVTPYTQGSQSLCSVISCR